MSIVWEKGREGFTATVSDPTDEVRFLLTVENFGGRWHWTVWRPGNYTRTAQRGAAATLHGAMWDAERATLRQKF